MREWRIKQRASDQKRAEADILADTARAEAVLEAAPHIALAGVQVADLRGQFIPKAPEAACALGVAYLAIVEEPDGRRKVVLGGCGAGTLPGVGPVEAFLRGWAQAQGLTDVYGDPMTGFASAYLP